MPEDVFRWVITIAVLAACIASIWHAIILAMVVKAGREAAKHVQEGQSRFGPLVDRIDALVTTSNKILEENRSRISDLSAEALAIAKTTRQQSDRISELLDDATGRAKARIAQIDETVDQTVTQVEQASEAVKSAVLKPVKEVNGIVAGVKAAFNTYAQGGTRNSPEHVTQDEEMFI